jgi:MFS family permease
MIIAQKETIYKNLIFIIVALIEVAFWISLSVVIGFLTDVIEDVFFVSLLFTLSLLFSVMYAPWSSFVLRKLGAEHGLILAIASRTLGFTILLFAISLNSLELYICSIILSSFSTSILYPSVNSVIHQTFHPHELAQKNSLNFTIITLMRIIGGGIGGGLVFLFETLWAQVFVTLLGASALSLSIALKKHSSEKATDVSGEEHNLTNSILSFTLAIKNNYLLLFLCSMPFVFISVFNVFVYHYTMEYSVEYLPGVIYSTEGIAVLLGGLLIKIKNLNADLGLLFPIGLMIIAAVVSIGVDYNMVQLLTSFFFFGLGVGLFIPLSITYLQRNHKGRDIPTLMTAKQMFDNLVFLLFIPTLGFLLGAYGSYLTVLMAGGLMFVLLISPFLKLTTTRLAIDETENVDP